ncbi:hypothetical protein I551_8486 [Mycobacterium ulcerans str. Harvey]|uniref:Uncharacterized protein n=1 Tax=Mycobacterium ulcerans str. Harvey TaxID=1299332 RepID=A0ABN0RAR0_MYCUL|nr:hypothetical protein I551_8486 [Mycobacterium ulcerans str. Harvey]
MLKTQPMSRAQVRPAEACSPRCRDHGTAVEINRVRSGAIRRPGY